MLDRNRLLALLAAAAVLALTAGQAAAARLRYHFAPVPGQEEVKLVNSPSGTIGERFVFLRAEWEPYNCPPPRPTCTPRFKHPCTGQCLAVPLCLPASEPLMQHRPDRTIYNYGNYTIEVVFLNDGSVRVVYNNSLFRAP